MKKFKISMDPQQPSSTNLLIDQLIEDKEVVVLETRGEELSVLLAWEARWASLLKQHKRVIKASVEDAIKDPAGTLGISAMQIALTDEQDAFEYGDADGQPVMIQVGINRFQSANS